MVWYFTSNQNPSTRHPTVQTSPGSLVNLVTVFASMRSASNTNGDSSDDENRNVSSRTNNPQSSHHLSSEENNGVSSSPLTASALQTLPGGEQPGGRRDPRYAHQDHATENDDARTTLTVETDAPDEYVSSLAMEHQPKVGGKFLGCCDYRRAVMILSVVTVITSLMDIVFLVVNITGSENEDFAPGFDDDVLVDEIYQVNLDLGKSVSIVNALEVIFGVVSLYGALHFKSLHVREQLNDCLCKRSSQITHDICLLLSSFSLD